jgi:HAD superfamily hydrolase (TIGR01549 family)
LSTRIRTAFLDFDRTLGEMTQGHYALYVQACEEHGVAAKIEALQALELDDAWARFDTPEGPDHRPVSTSHEAFRAARATIAIERLRAAGVEADDATFSAIGERTSELEEQPEHYRLYDDAIPAIGRLGRHGIEAIVVSNHVWALPEIVRQLDGHARFEGVITSARVGYRKPHPAIFEAALRLGSGAPEATLMVGDSVRADVEGGRRAGLRPVLIDRSSDPVTELEGALVVTTLLDLPLEWPS